MYLYIGFFSDDEVLNKRKYISKNNVKPIKAIFDNYLELNETEIKGAIGFFVGKENNEKPTFVMDIENIEATDDNIIINFNLDVELDITSGELGKKLYITTRRMEWFDKESGYYPLLLIMDKQIFNSIRKGSPNIKKISSTMQEIINLKDKNDWEGICNLHEPIDDIEKNNELWNNAKLLYDLGFACSKLGEPKNGMERNSSHLKHIKKYRELANKIYKRCYELDPWSYRYASAVAYRHYLNSTELTKPRGRRDGILKNEIEEAHVWFNKSLGIYPNNIKDNYRKGKLIIDKQLDNIRFSGNEMSREDFQEIEILKNDAINCLESVINIYEDISNEGKKSYFNNEYIKSLYTLSKFYCDEIEINWNEFLCSKIAKKEFNCEFGELNNLLKGEILIKRCFEIVTGISIEDELDVESLAKISKKTKISPIDILYALGNIYFKMYYIKLVKKSYDNIDSYKNQSEYFFSKATDLRKEFYKQKINFRNISYVNDMLGKLYILDGNYNDAIFITNTCKQGYIKNTNAAALILTEDKEKINKAKQKLEEAFEDRHNLAKPCTTALLIKTYKIMDDSRKMLKLMDTENKNSNKSLNKLLEIIL